MTIFNLVAGELSIFFGQASSTRCNEGIQRMPFQHKQSFHALNSGYGNRSHVANLHSNEFVIQSIHRSDWSAMMILVPSN